MSILKQKTLKNKVNLSGVGLHSGKKVNITLIPQKPNIGIYFKRFMEIRKKRQRYDSDVS